MTVAAPKLDRPRLEAERDRLLNRVAELEEVVAETPGLIAAAVEAGYRKAAPQGRGNVAKTLRGKAIDAEDEIESAKGELLIVDKLLGELAVAEQEARRAQVSAQLTEYQKAEREAAGALDGPTQELRRRAEALIEAGKATYSFWFDNRDALGTEYAPHAQGLSPFPASVKSVVDRCLTAATLGPDYAGHGQNPLSPYINFTGLDPSQRWGGNGEDYC